MASVALSKDELAVVGDECEAERQVEPYGFCTALAMQAAGEKEEIPPSDTLALQVRRLERSRLAVKDTLGKASLSKAEKIWLRSQRTQAALHGTY